MMRNRYKTILVIAAALFLAAAFSAAMAAGGPPLKQDACGVCHKDFKQILPKDHPDLGAETAKPCLTCHTSDPAKAGATKFSDKVHGIHRDGKAKLECSACHAL